MAPNAKPQFLFDNRFEDGTPVASQAVETGFSVLSIIDGRPYKQWKQGNTTVPSYITVNAGSALAADTIGIIGHNFNTAGVTYKVEYSIDNFAADTNDAFAAYAPTDDLAIFKTFTTQTKQYWRVTFTATTLAPFAGVIILGERLTFEKYPMKGFDPDRVKIVAETSKSKGGNILGSIINYHDRNISMAMKLNSESFINNTFKPAWESHLKLLKPFFFAWDITNHASQVYFVKVPNNFTLSMPYDSARRQLNLTMEGISE